VLFVHHPDDNETLLIGGCQLLVLIVPLDHLDLSRVALEWLIHAEITSTLTLSRIKFEDLQETLISSYCDVALLLVPGYGVHWSINTNLKT